RPSRGGPLMASDHSIRASDQDRDVVVAVLRDAYTAGRLTLEEFDERMTAAYASRTWGELRKLTEDLPPQPSSGSAVPGRPPPAPPRPPHPQPPGALPPAGHRPGRVVFSPVGAFWLVLALATRSAHEIVAPPLVLVLALVFFSLTRRR